MFKNLLKFVSSIYSFLCIYIYVCVLVHLCVLYILYQFIAAYVHKRISSGNPVVHSWFAFALGFHINVFFHGEFLSQILPRYWELPHGLLGSMAASEGSLLLCCDSWGLADLWVAYVPSTWIGWRKMLSAASNKTWSVQTARLWISKLQPSGWLGQTSSPSWSFFCSPWASKGCINSNVM